MGATAGHIRSDDGVSVVVEGWLVFGLAMGIASRPLGQCLNGQR